MTKLRPSGYPCTQDAALHVLVCVRMLLYLRVVCVYSPLGCFLFSLSLSVWLSSCDNGPLTLSPSLTSTQCALMCVSPV